MVTFDTIVKHWRCCFVSWQTIGIKVPGYTKLAARLKKLSEVRGMKYHELLEYWVTQEEKEEPDPTLTERVAALETRLAALETFQATSKSEI